MGIDLKVVLGHTLAFDPSDDLIERLEASLEVRAAANAVVDALARRNPRGSFEDERRMRLDVTTGWFGRRRSSSWSRELITARKRGAIAPHVSWAGFRIYWGRHALQMTFTDKLGAIVRGGELREAVRGACRVLDRCVGGPAAAIYLPDSTHAITSAGGWAEREGLTFEQICARLADQFGPPTQLADYREGGWAFDDFAAA